MLRQIFDCVVQNEVSGNREIALRFSQAEGGTSGVSFGPMQWDIDNNAAAKRWIRKYFSDHELENIRSFFQTRSGNIDPYNQRLKELENEIYEAQMETVRESVVYIGRLNGLEYMVNDLLCLAFAVDYHNQFYISERGKFHHHWAGVSGEAWEKRQAFLGEYQHWKLSETKWGRENPGDCNRRYSNILKTLLEQ